MTKTTQNVPAERLEHRGGGKKARKCDLRVTIAGEMGTKKETASFEAVSEWVVRAGPMSRGEAELKSAPRMDWVERLLFFLLFKKSLLL